MNTQYTGSKIVELRKEKGWTQKDVADQLHVSVAAVSKWERGLNYPDLALMESLANTLGTTVSVLLGIENESTEQVIRNITVLSTEEKRISEKRFWKKLSALSLTLVIFIASFCLVLTLVSDDSVMKKIFTVLGHGILDLSALIVGFTAWVLAIVGIFIRKDQHKRKICSDASLLCCAIALHLPTLISFLIIRFEYISTIEDVIGGYFFGSAILLIGTILFNACAMIVHRER